MTRLLPPITLLLAATLAGCGAASSTTSTSSFSGTKREVAQRIADFQSAASSSEPKKICGEDLSARLVRRLGGPTRCESAIKHQLGQVDDLEISIESVQLGAGGRSAQAVVKGTYEGKKRASTLALVKEGSGWKVAGVG